MCIRDSEYTISTSNLEASWLFDWGDGTDSGWVQIESAEESIIREHMWDSCGVYPVRVMYKSEYFPDGVWSDAIEVTIAGICQRDYPSAPSISGSSTGLQGDACDISVFSTSDVDGLVQYRIEWGDGDISEWCGFILFDIPVRFSHEFDESGSFEVVAQAKNSFGLFSEYSEVYTITIEPDTDGDGLKDSIEAELGSSKYDGSDAFSVEIDSDSYYIVALSAAKKILYDVENKISNDIVIIRSDYYQLDVDFDGSWDYFYHPSDGSISSYVEQESVEESGLIFGVPLWSFGAVIVCIVVCVIFLLIKTGIIVVYEEYVVEE